MPYVKKTENPEIVTPPTPLPVPSPTYETETGERYTAQGEVITAPRNRYTGDTHAEIPEYEGSYFVTENGTIPCGGYEMISDLVVNVQPKGLTQITITENGTYKPEEYDGYSQVVVNVQPNLASLSVTENGDYTPTAPVQGFSSVSVNVPVGGNTLKTLLDATKQANSLFYQYSGNDIADLISYNDTSEVTSMNSMFYGCSNITSVPLLNTSKVTSMGNIFGYCRALTSIPLFDTSNVTGMAGMFTNCERLTSIPALDASKVTSFNNTFSGCSALTEIKMTGMKTSFSISASTLFTREALVEIITNCATVSSTQYLTMGATNMAKLTQADIDAATAKGWTLQ